MPDWDAPETVPAPVVVQPPVTEPAPFQALTLRHVEPGVDEVHYLKRDGTVEKFRINAAFPPFVTFQDLLDGYLSDLLGAQVK